ncbi:MAG: laccase domain-containing protein [Ruminococcus sp.]|nr:laccase domain-containing protein [Ruminococcus sp.]
MKEINIIDDAFAYGGFTSGSEGLWTRNEVDDPPTGDYTALSRRLGIPLSGFIRPYQAGGDRVETVTALHGGSGVIKDNELRMVDGLVTAEKGIVLSVIAADCVPVYLTDAAAGVIGILHCGWRSAAGRALCNTLERMNELGASPNDIHIAVGPHICPCCYEVGAEVLAEYEKIFSAVELGALFTRQDNRLHLDLGQAIRSAAIAEGIPDGNIICIDICTCHDSSLFSYRRGDRSRQNLAYIMIKQ